MPKLTEKNAIEWTRAKVAEMSQFAEKELGVENLDKMKLLVSMSTRRRTSSGGVRYRRGWMSLGIYHYTRPLRSGKGLKYNEYASIAKHSVIGNIENASAEVNLAALIAHELAHVIDYVTMTRYGAKTEVAEKVNDAIDLDIAVADRRHKTNGGHGARWQAIYALLRAEFVNRGVTDPKFVEKKTRKRKAATGGKYAGITVQLITRNGHPYRYYSVNDDIVAVGFPVYTRAGKCYKIMEIRDDKVLKDSYVLLESGKGARAWIKENLT